MAQPNLSGLQDPYTVSNTAYAVRKELNAAQLKEKAVAVVEKAVADRKIAPASKDAYLAMCATQEGLSNFSKIMERTRAVISHIGGHNGFAARSTFAYRKRAVKLSYQNKIAAAD